MPTVSGVMKVKITAIAGEGSINDWSVTLELGPEVRVRDLKEMLTQTPHGLTFTKATKILARQASGMMYTLEEGAKVKKEMVVHGASIPKVPPPAKAVTPTNVTVPPKEPAASPPRKSATPTNATVPAKESAASPPRKAATPTKAVDPAPPPPAPVRSPPLVGGQQAAGMPKQAPAGIPKQAPVEVVSKVQAVASKSPAPGGYPQSATRLSMTREVVSWLGALLPVWPDHSKANLGSRAKSLSPSMAKNLAEEMVSAITADNVQTPLTAIFAHWMGSKDGPLSPGVSGLPRLHEAMMLMQDVLNKRLAPLASKFGLKETSYSFRDLYKALEEYISPGSSDYVQLMVGILHAIWFGSSEFNSKTVEKVREARGFSEPVPMNSALPAALFVTHAYHWGLPRLERRLRSAPRTLAFAELLLREYADAVAHPWVPTQKRQLVVWVIGASNKYEGELARAGFFEDAAGLLPGMPADSSNRMHVMLFGDDIQPFSSSGARVKVSSYGPVDMLGLPSVKPDLIVQFHSGIGTLNPDLVERWLSWMVCVKDYKSTVVLTCRSESEARAEDALLSRLQFNTVVDHTRSLYSGMAADPSITHDDNGWIVAIRGSLLPTEALSRVDVEALCRSVASDVKAIEDNKGSEVAEEAVNDEVEQQKNPAVFWGILDLKYDPDLRIQDRVKVLETGDGRASRFSGYGAAIMKSFKSDNKLEETVNRAVLVENKKITHDFFSEAGYSSLLPRQAAFPKAYTKDLAKKISMQLGLASGQICVLKLCNRARGAGCIPIGQEELDEALRCLLTPPADVEAWLKKADRKFSRRVSWGCFEEQLRHWWSNECPCFIVEEFCQSRPITKFDMEFDGTMRVGFSLHRMKETEDEDEIMTENGRVRSGKNDLSRPLPNDPGERDVFLTNAITAAFWSMDSHTWKNMAKRDTLTIQWLGGYWKLPEEDIYSSDLRGRIISKARQGTAPVDLMALHEVYAAFGDAVQQIFTLQEISPNQLVRRYADFPEFGAFVAARQACAMRQRDPAKSKTILGLSEAVNKKSKGGPHRECVDSYISRNQGVFEVMSQRWAEATKFFDKSLRHMPANATARFLQGMYLLEMEQWGQAIETMEDSLQLDPDFKAPYVNIGFAWLRLGKWENAIEVSEAGLYRHPQTPHCFYNIGMACYGLAMEDNPRLRPKSGLSWRERSAEAFGSCRSHLEKKSSMWKEEDDAMLATLKAPSRLPLPPLTNRDGWKFFNWRP